MRTIWKYKLEITDSQQLSDVPLPARVLSVGLDPWGSMSAWVLVDDKSPDRKSLIVKIVGTGNPIWFDEDASRFVGSVARGQSVWHVWV